jgi:hypothetical protein
MMILLVESRPSFLSSGNRELSEHSTTSPYSYTYSSTSTSTRVLPTIARPPPNELVLPADGSTIPSGLKLASKPPHTRMIRFELWWIETNWKETIGRRGMRSLAIVFGFAVAAVGMGCCQLDEDVCGCGYGYAVVECIGTRVLKMKISSPSSLSSTPAAAHSGCRVQEVLRSTADKAGLPRIT